MNIKYCFFFCLYLLTSNMLAQGNNCASMEPFCAGGSSLVFDNATNSDIRMSDAADFGCLYTQPNPSWFYIKIDQGGSLVFDLSQVDNNGAPIDTDFICWGPFTSQPPICGAANLNSNKVVDCSYSASSSEQITIPNALVDLYYVLLITNYDGRPGQITLTQTNTGQNNSGSTTCAILCPVSAGDDIILCNGDTATLHADFTPQGSFDNTQTTIQWLQDGVPLPYTTRDITVSQPGTYTVNIFNPACGTDVISDDVVVSGPGPFLSAAPHSLTVLGPGSGYSVFDLTENDETLLNGQEPTVYAISYFETEAAANDGTTPLLNAATYSGTDGQTIWARVQDLSNGCYILYSFNLKVIKYPIYFTPNGDTYHDYWGIDGLRGYKNVLISIFDRYGKLIKTLNPNSSSFQNRIWDGTLNEQMLPSDDYWFTVNYTDLQGKKAELKSHFSLIR